MLDPRALLAGPSGYRLFRALVSRPQRDAVVLDALAWSAGQRLLDIGCGPGDLAGRVPGVEYVGVDTSPEYLAEGRARYGGSGARFEHLDAGRDGFAGFGEFDLVVADGVVHHLDDEAARNLFAGAATVLRSGGRMVTIDGCFVDGQARVARRFLEADRGEFVRHPDAYLALARPAFGDVQARVHHDLLRIPYSHLILACRAPRS